MVTYRVQRSGQLDKTLFNSSKLETLFNVVWPENMNPTMQEGVNGNLSLSKLKMRTPEIQTLILIGNNHTTYYTMFASEKYYHSLTQPPRSRLCCRKCGEVVQYVTFNSVFLGNYRRYKNKRFKVFQPLDVFLQNNKKQTITAVNKALLDVISGSLLKILTFDEKNLIKFFTKTVLSIIFLV